MSVEHRINFCNEDLKRALGNYFKVDPKKITFIYVANFLGNHNLEWVE